MYADQRAGLNHIEPMKAYFHNRLIRDLFNKARNRAWKKMMKDQGVMEIMRKDLESKRLERQRLKETSEIQGILQLNK